MVGKGNSVGGYRYGFNGKENDNEVKGEGNQQDYGMRVYDPRVGKFLSVDPLTKGYPWYTPYQFAGNTPIQAIDLDGGEPDKVAEKIETTKKVVITADQIGGRSVVAVSKVVSYKFTPAAVHLLSLVSGVEEKDINQVSITNSVGTRVPDFDPYNGGGAMTTNGMDSKYSIRATDNHFSPNSSSYGRGDRNTVNDWFSLFSHEVGHIRDIQEIGASDPIYMAVFGFGYITSGGHDEYWREQRAEKGSENFNDFRQFVNQYYGVGKIKALFENKKNTNQAIIKRIDQWWNKYKQSQKDLEKIKLKSIRNADFWWNQMKHTKQQNDKK